MDSNEKLKFFMHTHNSCTRYGGNFSLLTKSADIPKRSMIFQTIVRIVETCKRGGKHKKNEGGAKMAAVFTITEISHLVIGLFNNLVRPIESYSYL